MWFSVSEHLLVTLYSFFMGIFLGVMYDCIKLTRVLAGVGIYSGAAARLYRIRLPIIKDTVTHKTKKRSREALSLVYVFIGDIVYSLIAAGAYSLFLFHAIRGQARWYFILASGLGFLIYYLTVSRFVLTVLETLVFLVRAALRYLLEIALLPFRGVIRIAMSIWRMVKAKLITPIKDKADYCLAKKYTEKVQSRLSREISFD